MNTVFLLGCARSGTTILTRVIAPHPDIEMLYEANWLWMDNFREQRDFPKGDQLFAEDAMPEIVKELNEAFKRIGVSNSQAKIVFEKDPRHSLRIPFINVVFPECRFINLVRDGRNVVCSLMKRHEAMRKGHTNKKKDHQWWRSGDGWAEQRIQDWQRYREMPLIEACTWQWRLTLEKVKKDFSNIESERILEVRYEDLVLAPLREIKRILNFLEINETQEVKRKAQTIHNEASKWQFMLNVDEQKRFRDIAGATLIDWGYEKNSDWIFDPDDGEQQENLLQRTINKIVSMVKF